MSRAPDALRRWATQELAARMVRALVRALGPEGAVLPIKGTLLGRTVYADLGERAMADCDVVLVRPALNVALARLVARGFIIQRWSNDPNVVELTTPAVPGLGLDLHRRPLPVGLGAVDAEWLAVGAREDTSLFGVRVLLPDDRRLLVHLLGHVVRDHVFRARLHTAEDITRLLAQSPWPPEDFALTLTQARLRVAGSVALTWVRRVRGDDPSLAALETALALTPFERARARWALERFLSWSSREAPPALSRLLARSMGDSPRDIARGLATATAGSLSARLKNRRTPHEPGSG